MRTSDVVFIVGAGRSGTTWLQLMLGAHPAIATGQESQLFHKYLRVLDEQWKRELSYPESEELRKHGITSYMDEIQFTDLLREFALSVFGNVFAVKPGARLFLEKSPNNSFNIDLIYRCFPDAMYIHLIRDGRDVVTSMLAARSGWGRQWAPDHAADAAADWVEAVTESGRLASKTDKYIEVRYEDLLTSGCAEMSTIFKFLGIKCTELEIADLYNQFSFDKLHKNAYSRKVFLNPGVAKASGTERLAEPTGFFRKGVSGDWKNSLSDVQLKEINWVAGELLLAMGYVDGVKPPSRQPASMRRREFKARIKMFIKSLGSRLLS